MEFKHLRSISLPTSLNTTPKSSIGGGLLPVSESELLRDSASATPTAQFVDELDDARWIEFVKLHVVGTGRRLTFLHVVSLFHEAGFVFPSNSCLITSALKRSSLSLIAKTTLDPAFCKQVVQQILVCFQPSNDIILNVLQIVRYRLASVLSF